MPETRTFGLHKVTVCDTDDELRNSVEDYLNCAILDILKKRPRITIGVSGGSMPPMLAPILARLSDSVIERMQLFPLDERLVPLESSDSNVGSYLRLLPSKFAPHFIKADEIHDASRSSLLFTEELLKHCDLTKSGLPVVDIAFLGLGPDGHTCSLFPGHPLLDNASSVAAIEDSPKPPLRRITVTLPVLDSARHVVFITTGAGKANVLKKIMKDRDELLPPTKIKRNEGTEGQIQWFIDTPAFGMIQD